MFSGVYFDTNESMRLLTAGSLVRVQLGEPKERNRKTVPFSFCFSALIRTAAQRLTVDEKSVSAENRGKMRGR